MPSSTATTTSTTLSKNDTGVGVAACITSVVLSIGFTATIGYYFHKKQSEKDQIYWENRRQEERTGRIRAEKKLRKALLDATHNASTTSSDGENTKKQNNKQQQPDQNIFPPMNISCIGVVSSPYTKRMGTPRQGTLCPHSRGFIQISPAIPPEILDGIEEYSHIWIVFCFHENTNLTTSRKTKIRPPRGNGIKVGQLATRSPHRPNPLGLSVVELDKFDKSKRQLWIRGFDLVNGTPVYDIKPYVHWDTITSQSIPTPLKVPTWVESKDDVLPSVTWSAEAETSLQELVQNKNQLSPWYPNAQSNSISDIQQTLCEILAQDPRSSHKGITKNQRGTLSNNSKINTQVINGDNNIDKEVSYRILFGSTEVEFVVRESGAHVINISPVVL